MPFAFFDRLRMPRQVWGAPRAAVLVFVIGLVATGALAWRLHQDFVEQGQVNISVESERITSEIQARMGVYVALLSGGAALFQASEEVNHADWHDYATVLDLPRDYPGIQALSYAPRVPAGNRAAFEAERRADLDPDFSIHARLGATGDVFPALYIEPNTQPNRMAFGFDLYGEPSRRAAMDAAADAGRPRLSRATMLVAQEDHQMQPGALLFMPVYRSRVVPGDVGQRRAALRGFIYIVFRAHDLAEHVLSGQNLNFGLEVVDGEADGDGVLLYRWWPGSLGRAPTLGDASMSDASPGQQRLVRSMQVGGRRWQARFTAPWDFGVPNARGQMSIVLVAGVLISLLGAAVAWSLMRTREQALHLAGNMTGELRASQHRFERMVGGTADGVWEINLSSRAVYCSPRCVELLGGMDGPAKSGHIRPRDVLSRVDARDRARVLDICNTAIRARGEFDTRVRIQAGDLGTRWFRVRGRAVRVPDGGLYLSGALSDIQAQTETQEREERLLRVFELSPDVSMTFDPEGHVTYLNAAARRAFGVTEGPGGMMHASAYARLQALRVRTRRPASGPSRRGGDVPGDGMVWQEEAELPLADGSLLPVSQVTAAHGEPGAKAQYYSVVMRDLTLRRRAEAALREAEGRYTRALAGANDGIWEYNLQTNQLFCSERMETLLGVGPGEGPRTPEAFRERIHPEDLAVHIKSIQGLARSGGADTWDLRLLQGDGVYRWMRMRGMSTFHSDGRAVLNSGTLSEIHQARLAEDELKRHRDDLAGLVAARTASAETARQEAERARAEAEYEREIAESASRSKSEFLANMSHELRTPMHAILSFAGFGVERAARAERDKLLHYFGNIRKSGTRLLALLNDLLDLSKLEAGKMEMQLCQTDPALLLREALAEAEALAGASGVHIELQLPRTALGARVDGARLLQVLRNLLSNAIKFSPRGGRITLHLGEALLPGLAHGLHGSHGVHGPHGAHEGHEGQEGHPAHEHHEAGERAGYAISVSDEGVGIPEGELEAVFDKFVQSSKTKTGAGGTGLGLAICREIVHAHGGSISARNHAAPARGACFTVLLPLDGGADPEQGAQVEDAVAALAVGMPV